MLDVKLVINFDVPLLSENGFILPAYNSYMRMISKTGRSGNTGIALTIFDNERDEDAFWKIVEHYKMSEKVQELKGGS